jgi:hypothetical protein
MIKKFVFSIIFLIIATIVGIFVQKQYQNYENQKAKDETNEKFEKQPYFTKYHFTKNELNRLEFFVVKNTPDYYNAVTDDKGPDYSYMKVESTEDTKKAITVLNYLLFDVCKEPDARKVAESYGLSYDNRITLEWFDEHIPEALDIIQNKYNGGNWFPDSSMLYDYYTLITDGTAYTPYALSYTELETFSSMFQIYYEPGVVLTRDENEELPDYSSITFTATENTAEIIEIMNFLLFTQQENESQNGIDKAKELGLANENPVTFEWIISHPKETLEIKNGLKNYGEVIMNGEERKKIKEKYFE